MTMKTPLIDRSRARAGLDNLPAFFGVLVPNNLLYRLPRLTLRQRV
tara:strand:+ start:994 stop:1131 length:138 start_codon:yes stop_codon:yes gene_type:complete